jgi:hypothetical protein
MVPPDGSTQGSAVIEVHVSDLKQIFKSLDPAPFRERDIDPKAEEFIAGWAREIPTDKAVVLVIHVDRDVVDEEHVVVVRDAIRGYFEQRASAIRQQLRVLFWRGRTSLVIGLVFLAVSTVLGNLAEDLLKGTQFSGLAQESLLIAGWVAMWKPLELFLYDWWPVLADARLFDRLSNMRVNVVPVSRPR